MSIVQCDDEDVALKTKAFGGGRIGRDWAIERFIATVKGLAEVLEYESNMLESHEVPDYEEINLCKERGLRDLNKSISDVKRYMDKDIEDKIEDLLSDLRVKLHRNSELLHSHLDAVKDLSEIFQTSTSTKEADETHDTVWLRSGIRND